MPLVRPDGAWELASLVQSCCSNGSKPSTAPAAWITGVVGVGLWVYRAPLVYSVRLHGMLPLFAAGQWSTWGAVETHDVADVTIGVLNPQTAARRDGGRLHAVVAVSDVVPSHAQGALRHVVQRRKGGDGCTSCHQRLRQRRRVFQRSDSRRK